MLVIFKAIFRRRKTLWRVIKSLCKVYNCNRKKNTQKGCREQIKIGSNYENTMTKGERRGYRRSKTKKTRQERGGREGRGLKGKTREELARHRGERRRQRGGRKKGGRRRKRRRKRKISRRRRWTEAGKGWRRKKKTKLYAIRYVEVSNNNKSRNSTLQ